MILNMLNIQRNVYKIFGRKFVTKITLDVVPLHVVHTCIFVISKMFWCTNRDTIYLGSSNPFK